jgi:GNAT superfamily N-acetyltransferase
VVSRVFNTEAPGAPSHFYRPTFFGVIAKFMVALERVTAENVEAFKRVRLRALAEAPSAFGSTYAREIQFTDDEWLARVARWDGESGLGFLAVKDGEACGIAGVFLDLKDGKGAHLVSMWTDPAHRQKGVGRLLVEAVGDWARVRGARRLQLMVTSKNEGAIRFYERLGFAMTGRTEPYPNDAALIEFEMTKGI